MFRSLNGAHPCRQSVLPQYVPASSLVAAIPFVVVVCDMTEFADITPTSAGEGSNFNRSDVNYKRQFESWMRTSMQGFQLAKHGDGGCCSDAWQAKGAR
jgi:hypothetical protein